MPKTASSKPLAKGVILCMYPDEQRTLLRLTRQQGFRTPFDTVRLAMLKAGFTGFREPRVREVI